MITLITKKRVMDIEADKIREVNEVFEVDEGRGNHLLDKVPHLVERYEGQEIKKKVDELNLADLKVAELKELAKEKELEGYSNLKKDELIELLEG